MYTTHGLWEQLEISGTKLSVYQCRIVPDEDDLLVYGRERFENVEDSVFYEVYISGSNKPFFSSKTEPSPEEIEFQLREYKKSPISNFFKSIF